VVVVGSELDKLACNEAGVQAVLALPQRDPSWRWRMDADSNR
jgi:hypothetical protein